MMTVNNATGAITICALYKFVRLEHYLDLREPLLATMTHLNVKGTLLLAAEGINGTIAGSQANVDAVLDYLNKQTGLANISHKESYADENPFHRTKVKLKKKKLLRWELKASILIK